MNTPLDLRALLLDPANNGAYFFDRNDRESLLEAATDAGLRPAPVDFGGCAGKDDALARIAAALAFPDWFGGNRDALADCLGDLSWLLAPGYLLLIENSSEWQAAQNEDFDTLLAILNEAALEWRERNVAFWALLPLPADALAQLEQREPLQDPDFGDSNAV
jgi:RNAse (barnase) inhibitor barstar